MIAERDRAGVIALERGILKEIKHRTNDIINNITTRLNESLNEIIQTVTDGAQDLEECIKQDISDAFPTLKIKGAAVKNSITYNFKPTLNSQVKVGLKDWKEKTKHKDRAYAEEFSKGPSRPGRNKVKIGLKEWKQWKEKKVQQDVNSNEPVQIKEENEFEEQTDLNLADSSKFLTLEDCMNQDTSEDPMDRYTKSSNPGNNNSSSQNNQNNVGSESESDIGVPEDNTVSGGGKRKTKRTRKFDRRRNDELVLDSDSDSSEMITSTPNPGKDVEVKSSIKAKEEPTDNMPVDCELCSFKAKQNSSLQRHMQEVHDKSLRCTECDYATGRRIKLLYHIRDKH